jgi:hypothetical protein
MNIIPIREVWFDDAATSAMGKAFDHARFEISGLPLQCVRSSQSELLTPPRVASAIPPASMSKH